MPAAQFAEAPDMASLARSVDLAGLPDSYFQDPSPTFRLLRDHDPIHRNADGTVLLTRYEDVRTVWRDLSGTVDKRELFLDRWGDGPLFECHTTHMLFRDPPDHDRLRAILNPFFTPTALNALHGPVAKSVDTLIDQIAALGEVDFAKEFAFPLPTQVICALIGLPFEDRELLRDLGESVVDALNPNIGGEEIADAHAKTAHLKEYIRDHVQRVRGFRDLDPKRDLLSALVGVERGGGAITQDEIIHTCILMFVGGQGTTMNMLSSTLHLLLEFPDQLADLRAHPDIVDTAMDELFRFITPIQLQGRRTTRAVTLPSGELPANTEVVLCAGSANRDERIFEEPDRLVLRRKPNQHIAFGAGIHFCLGRPLAKLTLRTVLPRLLQRFPTIERAGDAVYRKLPRFRSLETLPLRFAG